MISEPLEQNFNKQLDKRQRHIKRLLKDIKEKETEFEDYRNHVKSECE